jgi:hypothetical protein
VAGWLIANIWRFCRRFLKIALPGRHTFRFTSTGKTTLVNALLAESTKRDLLNLAAHDHGSDLGRPACHVMADASSHGALVVDHGESTGGE